MNGRIQHVFQLGLAVGFGRMRSERLRRLTFTATATLVTTLAVTVATVATAAIAAAVFAFVEVLPGA